MAVVLYKEGEKPIRVEPNRLQAHLQMGYSLSKNFAKKEEDKAEKEAAVDLEQARLAYEDKFGKKPHHKMKLETILEELNGNEPVQPE